LNRSTSLVATGSFGEATSNSHSALEGLQGNGSIHLSEDEKSHLDFYNSTFAEQFDFTITSNGTVITGSLEKTGGGNLTMRFANDEYIILDCDPTPVTVTITPGTDISPVYRYYYILQSTPTIITEGSNWSSAEHIKVARINVPLASFVQTKNVYSNQNINNDAAFVAGDLSGGYVHLSHKIRESLGATYKTVGGGLGGGAGGGEYLDVSGGTTVRFIMDAGVVMQMHEHAFNAVNTGTGDVVLVRNFSGTAWNDISNLYDIVNDSLGATINNKYFNLEVIAIASKETDYVMINVPGGSYNTLPQAIEDKDKFDDHTIPLEFKGVATPICRMTIRKAANAWVVHQIDDQRGINVAAFTGATVSGGYSDVDAIAAVEGEATLDLTGLITNPADSKGFFTGISDDLGFYHDGSNSFIDHANTVGSLFIRNLNSGSNHIYLDTHSAVLIRDRDDGNANLFNFNTTSRAVAIGTASDPMTINQTGDKNIAAGSLIMDGSGTDDESLQVPYLTVAPSTLANGMIWMEADGLHFYSNGGETIIPGV